MKPPPVIVVQLFHMAGPFKLQTQEFTESVIRIGKYSDCQVRFPPDLTPVSRMHAEIVRQGNQFKLTDRSKNGTFVNGERVTERYLKDGDILEFSEGGPKVSFLTEMKEAPTEPVIIPTPPTTNGKERLRVKPPGPPPREKPQVTPNGEMKAPPVVVVDVVKAPLTIQYGPTIRTYKELPVTIGKSPKCQCAFDHPAVYDQHAQIFFSQNQYWIKDLTGKRLVQINRAPISLQAPLSESDEVALSPQGPFFRYIGEGRLAEALEVPAEEAPRDKKEAGIDHSKGQPTKGVLPKLKKLFAS